MRSLLAVWQSPSFRTPVGALAALFIGLAPLLIPIVAQAGEVVQVGDTAVVTGAGSSGLRLRSGPGMSYRVIATLSEHTTVQIIAGPVSDGGDDWYQLGAGGVVVGWGAERFLSPAGG